MFKTAIYAGPGHQWGPWWEFQHGWGGGSKTLELEFDMIAKAPSDDSGSNKSAVIYLTKEGDETLYKIFERNIGRYISLYYGEKIIIPEKYIAEPMRAGKIYFPLESKEDEVLAIRIIKAYHAN